MKAYIAGPITGKSGYKKKFRRAEKMLKRKGYAVLNPAKLGKGFLHHEYMRICYSMVDVCNVVYFLKGFEESKGAKMEHEHAKKSGKTILYEKSKKGKGVPGCYSSKI